MNTELPEGWKWEKLGDATKIIMGQSPPSTSYNANGIGLPFFQGKAEFTELHPVVEKWCSVPNKVAEPNDILLSVRAPVGTTNIADQTCCIGRGLAAIRFENYKYGFYFLRSRQHELDSKGTGTTFKAISGETIRETLFPLPSSSTQQAIVSKIEELFSEIDKGIEQLKTARLQLKTYRQAVLKWAFEGKLTEEWREENRSRVCDPSSLHTNLMVAEEEVVYKKKSDLPEGWRVKVLGQISEMCLGKMLDKQKNKGTLKPYLRNISVRWGTFDLNNLEQMKFEEDEFERYSLKKNDLVICEGGEPGRCAIWNFEDKIMIQKALHRVRVNEHTNVKYLYHLMKHKSLNGSLQDSFTGTTIKHLTGKELKKIEVPFTSLEEQNQIVQEIESRLSIADKMEESISQSLQQAEVLRQSILKRAFEGKLVLTN